jgi:hypothetical protein
MQCLTAVAKASHLDEIVLLAESVEGPYIIPEAGLVAVGLDRDNLSI